MEKIYSPQSLENTIYKEWVDARAFGLNVNPKGKPYCIIMPPANVTGSLHIGHALTFTIQDILVRFHRLLGDHVLWQPGTDHAGIATQIVVEKKLVAQNISRTDLGREEFIKEVWKWRDQSGGRILHQLKSLGASADWSRERFTMDASSSAAVTKVFVDLYRQGLIYRAKRLVNWDPHLQSAISDLEVEQRENQGVYYYLKYEVEGEDKYLEVATTRPETYFGDMAVAVHPQDQRYAHLIGKKVRLPLLDRTVPIIADEYSDPEKGSGVVKITPAHDFNDFEVGQRHDLDFRNILNADGTLNEEVPDRYQKLPILKAREKLIEALREAGFLLREEPTENMVPYSERSGVMVEPYLTDQWFVDAKLLAKQAIAAVEKEETSFIPANWSQHYFEWMHNIQPWCISRQIWWGHSIPVWYGPDEKVFVALTYEEALEEAEAHYQTHNIALRQDPDVLDTWFSSALWPFTTLGWPHKTKELETFYPTSVLVTGFDIIFFWVARMMMMGLHFMKKVPFADVYIHALVRDEKGQKMSKSKGNIIDPMDLIDEYGADSLRFALASLASPGRDVNMSSQKVMSARNFMTKLWNAARFLLMNGCEWPAPPLQPSEVSLEINLWILHEYEQLRQEVTGHLHRYHINKAAQALYHFTWGRFCDWYVEFSKPYLRQEGAQKKEIQKVAGWVMGNLLHLLHPIAPFITETLWKAFNGPGLLMLSTWPIEETIDDERRHRAHAQVALTQELISQVRSLKADLNIAPGAYVKLLKCKSGKGQKSEDTLLLSFLIQEVGRIKEIELLISDQSVPPNMVEFVVGAENYFLSMDGLLDIEGERKRLQQNISKVEGEIAGIKKKMENPAFIENAPPHIIELNRTRLEEYTHSLSTLEKAIQRLEKM